MGLRRAFVGCLVVLGCSGSPAGSASTPELPTAEAVEGSEAAPAEAGDAGAKAVATVEPIDAGEVESSDAIEPDGAVAIEPDGTVAAKPDGTGGAKPDGMVAAKRDGTAIASRDGKVGDSPWLVELLSSHPKIARLMKDPTRYRLQVLVTVISPKRTKSAKAVEHGYRVDVEYVYPASAIKTFASVAALRKLEALRQAGHAVGLDTPMAYCEGKGRRKYCVTTDESNLEGGTITLGHEIRKMQLVSNNVSFNRLYELVGHRELNEDMWSLGFGSLRIHHRMYGVKDPLVQRTTPRVELRPSKGGKVVIPARVSDLELPATEATELRIGVAYIDDEVHAQVDEPLDFSGKNYVSIRDLHRLTLALNRPDLPGVPDLGLRASDREFLLRAMVEDPLASTNPVYTDPHDSGLRYHAMIKGMMRVMPLERIHYAGKAGRAYGFLLDNAYVEDTKSGRAMAVTLVAYANDNGVLNDNEYEYDEVTRPLVKALGEVLARAVLLGEGL